MEVGFEDLRSKRFQVNAKSLSYRPHRRQALDISTVLLVGAGVRVHAKLMHQLFRINRLVEFHEEHLGESATSSCTPRW